MKKGTILTVIVIALLVVVISFFFLPTKKEKPSSNVEGYSEQVVAFSEDNNVSLELAESIELALSQTDIPSTIESLREWKQIDDYSDGQRYTTWSYSVTKEQYYYMTFYVKDNVVESIRDRDNGLEFLYQKN